MEIMKISARLLPAVEIAGVWVSIEPTTRAGHDGKPVWKWYIDFPSGEEYFGADLRGWGNARDMMGAMLSFLDACGESLAYDPPGENADLFPRPVAEWARDNSDEIGMMRIELEGEN